MAIMGDSRSKLFSHCQQQNTTNVAIGAKGAEYLYDAATAHKVAKSRAAEIAAALNRAGYMLYSDAQTWFVYTVDDYSMAYDYATFQAFRFKGSNLVRVSK